MESMSHADSHARLARSRHQAAHVLGGMRVGRYSEQIRQVMGPRVRSMGVSQAAMTGKGIDPQGARTQLSEVEAFVARHGADLPPKELAERFQLHVSRTRMPSAATKLDRVVRSALISTDNVSTSEAAVRSMIRMDEITPQTGIMLLNWFILLRSGRFGGSIGSFAR